MENSLIRWVYSKDIRTILPKPVLMGRKRHENQSFFGFRVKIRSHKF